jgi:hypothetical protein
MALTKVTNSMISGAEVNVFDFMTPAQIADVQARTNTLDVTAAINAALASLNNAGGTVRIPRGLYRTTAEIYIPPNAKVVGDGLFGGQSAYDQGCTTIYAAHSGNSIFNLVGSGACRIQDLCLQSGPPSGPYPQTGIMLGRTTAASSGYHHIERISIYGCYDAAAIYSIASEDNYWEDIFVWIYGGTAKYCLYTCIGTSATFPTGITQPFYTSSNLDNVFNRFWFTNSSFNANSAIIYIDGAEATGSWSFFGGYMTASSGSYVEIANGYVDGLSMLGPITFVGCNGERLAGGDPYYAYKLTASIAVTLPNLNIIGGRFDLLSGGPTRYLFWQSNNLILSQPNITLKPPEAFVYAEVVLRRELIYGGTINLGRFAQWKTATLTNSWVNALGAPYPVPSFMIDSTGRVHLRGTISSGTGPIMTLPEGYRPCVTWRIPTQSNGAAALLSIDSAGVVDILSGSNTNLELGNLSFDMTSFVLP